MFSERGKAGKVLRIVGVAVALSMCVPMVLSFSSQNASAQDPLVFRVGTVEDILNLNPFGGILSIEMLVFELMYDPLTGIEADLTPGPRLAESWWCDASGLVWEFNLTSGAIWHDGEIVTAEDVEFTYNLIMSEPEECALWADGLVDVVEVVATSDHVLRITTSIPKPSIPALHIPILPEHLWSAIDPSYVGNVDVFSSAYFPDGPVGCGPFVLRDFVHNTNFSMTGFDDYHDGAPNIDELRFDKFLTEAGMLTALDSGMIDLAYEMPSVDLWDSVLAYERVDGQAVKTARLKYLGINCASEDIRAGFPSPSENLETTNLSVRKAIAYAVDRAYVVDTVFGGLAERGETLIPGAHSFWHYDVPVEDEMGFDLAIAADILDEAGYTDSDFDGVRENSTSGVPLSFSLHSIYDYPSDIEIAQKVSDLLWQIGIDAEVVPVSEAQMFNIWFDCGFDLFIWTWWADPTRDMDIDFLLSTMTTDMIPTGPDDYPKWSDSFYSNAHYDSLYDLQHVEIDAETRRSIVHEMQGLLYEECPYIVLYYPMSLFAYRTDTFVGYPDMTADPAASPSFMRFYMGLEAPYDNLPPSAAFSIAPEEGNPSTLFSFDATGSEDLHDDISELKFRWDWEDDGVFDTAWSTDHIISVHQFAAPGTYTVRLQVKDTLGLVDETTRQVLIYDDQAPVTEMRMDIEPNADGWCPGSVLVTLVAEDEWSEVLWTNFSLDGSDWITYAAPFTVSTDGEHVLAFYSVDSFKNIEEERNEEIRIDSSPPYVRILIDGEEAAGFQVFNRSVEVEVESNESVSDLSSIEVSIDDGEWEDYESPFNVSTDGSHKVEVTVTDLAGNANSTEASFIVDTAPPMTGASHPTYDFGWVNVSVPVTLSATDAASGVSETWYRLDSGAWTEYTDEITVSGDGTHTLEFYSSDLAGNTEEVSSIAIKVDATKPSIEEAEVVYEYGSAYLVYSCSDSLSGLSYSEYSLDGGQWVNAGNGATVSVMVEDEGEHTISIRVHDEAGNYVAEVHEFTVDFGGSDALVLAIAVGAVVVAVAVAVALLMLKRKKPQ